MMLAVGSSDEGGGWRGPRVDSRVALVAATLLGCATGDPAEPLNTGLGGEGDSATVSGDDSNDGRGTSVPVSDGAGGTTSTTDEPGSTAATTWSDPTDHTTGPTSGSDPTGPCTEQIWARDDDDDGYGDADVTQVSCDAPPGYVQDATDCNDDDPTIFPGANESCGGPDRNCDFEAPPLCGSCLELLDSGNGDDTGLYTIDADGPDEPLPPTSVWCDQATDGGGWTLVQRTVWAPAQTDALRTSFATWEAQTVGNANPGQAYRLQGGAWGHLNLQLDHMLVHELRLADGGACEPLYYLGSGGDLTVEGGVALLTGLTSDASMVSGTELSTTDTGPSQNCVAENLGVPWFFGQCCATCPVYQGSYWTEPHPMVSYVADVPDLNGNTQTEVCSGDAQMAINGSVYVGVDSMAYYLR